MSRNSPRILAFGVLFATAITLYLVPCAVLAGADLKALRTAAVKWYGAPFTNRANETVELE